VCRTMGVRDGVIELALLKALCISALGVQIVKINHHCLRSRLHRYALRLTGWQKVKGDLGD